MKKWFLILIVTLGFLLRVIGLTNHPAGFTPDEASFGYDAYSILKTGRDQWGATLPLVFKSFGDDKLPIYTYLALPSVAILGLNEFAVRLPNAILGSLAIVVVYLLVYELYKSKKLALLSGFLLAISPWHIMLSRGAFEANLTTFFLPLAVFLFLKSFNNSRFLILAFLVFLVNIFTYHTARILTPAILLFLIFNYKEKLKLNKSLNISLIFSAILVLISIAGFLFGGTRAATSSIFNLGFNDDRYFAQIVGEPKIISQIFYNKPLYVAKQFLNNYFSYFSPQFLFTNGPNEGTYGMVPGIGTLYLVEVFFLMGFLVKLVKTGIQKEDLLLIFWILISSIPAALTKGPGFAANRVAFMMPAIQIISAIGGIYLYQMFEKNKRSLRGFASKNYFVVTFSILLFINFIFFVEKYLVGQTVNQAPDMIYGVNQFINKLSGTQNWIIISKSISEPQIYLAFYNKINPIEYQMASSHWTLVNGWVDQQGEYSLGKYIFRNINYNVDQKLIKAALVGKPNDFPSEIKPDFVISYPNFHPAYFILNTQ
jgi:4-amino-4-deoxy-L-arabinose transferase-like glycosyltransferase